MKIVDVTARQILDSRGNPTVECEVLVDGETKGLVKGVASVPSGASTGDHEAVEIRDGEMIHFWGKGVMKAVDNVNNEIGPKLLGMPVDQQREIDNLMIEMDGTENKSRLGANAILAVSLACARAAAKSEGLQLYEYLSKFKKQKLDVQTYGWKISDYRLPVPFMNVLNGGKHAPDGVDFQEFMLVPHGFESFSEALESADETFMKLKEILHKDGYATLVGDEGGFAPAFDKNEQAIEYILKAIELAGFKAGEQIFIAMDPAMSELYDKNLELYVLKKENLKLKTDELDEYWMNLLSKYPIVSLEDGFDQDDWQGWERFMEKIPSLLSSLKTRQGLQVVGDDLLVTNSKRVQKAIDEHACDVVLIKLNQIGTLTETVDVINLAYDNGFSCMVSHRSGETEDSFIADLAVGMGTGQIKAGSLSRSERIVKYNRLLRIEERLNEQKS